MTTIFDELWNDLDGTAQAIIEDEYLEEIANWKSIFNFYNLI